jgi:thiaminase
MWIDVLDRESSSVSSEESALLEQIFRTCAEYENRLWDALYA